MGPKFKVASLSDDLQDIGTTITAARVVDTEVITLNVITTEESWLMERVPGDTGDN